MLDFAFSHQKAHDLMTQDRANGLREYELSGDDWNVVAQLRDALKVGGHFWTMSQLTWNSTGFPFPLQDLQGCNPLLLSWHAQPCDGHPGYGPH
jgi:hypothetical protein